MYPLFFRPDMTGLKTVSPSIKGLENNKTGGTSGGYYSPASKNGRKEPERREMNYMSTMNKPLQRGEVGTILNILA